MWALLNYCLGKKGKNIFRAVEIESFEVGIKKQV
jgi:hypothetical protein